MPQLDKSDHTDLQVRFSESVIAFLASERTLHISRRHLRYSTAPFNHRPDQTLKLFNSIMARGDTMDDIRKRTDMLFTEAVKSACILLSPTLPDDVCEDVMRSVTDNLKDIVEQMSLEDGILPDDLTARYSLLEDRFYIYIELLSHVNGRDHSFAPRWIQTLVGPMVEKILSIYKGPAHATDRNDSTLPTSASSSKLTIASKPAEKSPLISVLPTGYFDLPRPIRTTDPAHPSTTSLPSPTTSADSEETSSTVQTPEDEFTLAAADVGVDHALAVALGPLELEELEGSPPFYTMKPSHKRGLEHPCPRTSQSLLQFALVENAPNLDCSDFIDRKPAPAKGVVCEREEAV